jgi:hypothetical protein
MKRFGWIVFSLFVGTTLWGAGSSECGAGSDAEPGGCDVRVAESAHADGLE